MRSLKQTRILLDQELNEINEIMIEAKSYQRKASFFGILSVIFMALALLSAIFVNSIYLICLCIFIGAIFLVEHRIKINEFIFYADKVERRLNSKYYQELMSDYLIAGLKNIKKDLN